MENDNTIQSLSPLAKYYRKRSG